MSRIDDLNYWNDHRVRAGMINRGKVIEEGNTKFLVVESYEEDEPDIKLKMKFEVCGTCDGHGSHTNPSIDAGGLSYDDFYEDPDFAEEYMSGTYDVTCNGCKGLRVEPVVDRENNDPEMVKRYDDHMEAEYNHAAECAAERAMGA